MEGILTQRATPLLKCAVLFLFIFTAKVLTSRPQDVQDLKSVHLAKSSHYIRTFTKYHHRRLANRNTISEWQDQPKVIQKRSVDFDDTDEFISNDADRDVLFQASNSLRENIKIDKNAISASEKGSRNDVKSNEVKKYKDKEMVTTSTPMPGIVESRMTCLYKTNHLTTRVTPPYEDDERNAQLMVENDGFDIGPISESALPSGEPVQLEHCTDPRAYCYTLWRQNTNGNITVLGQGCWRGAASGGCAGCTRVTQRLPATKFCCCHTALCNQHFASVQEVTVSMKVESPPAAPSYVSAATSGVLALTACVLIVIALSRRCKKRPEQQDKGEMMGSGPDALATGLLCVDNLTLIEHIGEGKFGSVWRGTLGATPVAVKLYSHVTAWQKEAAIYALPHLAHPNLLRYYGSDTRQSLTETSTREHLIVLELCTSTLRSRLEQAPVTWVELATLAHGLASALAHLHTPNGNKPCIVHRDVTSRNVLCVNGTARLADLGLAQPLSPRCKREQPPTTITEAGTLRYLSPEALEGALDLSEARAALCAVDVYALGLVLWEMLWRCSGAHSGPTPPYAPPYHHLQLPNNPNLAQMQSVVSRNKARPPLPAGPGCEPRALRLMSDTCDECWDHDAEARLTAVCVEERMSELKQMLHSQGPLVHDNNLYPHAHDSPAVVQEDKNSNCTQSNNYDVTTPLLYPHPHIGRNACIERNTNNNTANPVELIHKSLKDISVPTDQPRVENIEESILSVARVNHLRVADFENSDRLNEIRSYQRPLDYVPNDVTSHDDRRPKQTNLLQEVKVEKSKWGIRKFFEKKLNLNPKPLDTEVKLLPEVNNVQNKIKTSIVNEKRSNLMTERPANLILNDNGMYDFEIPCTLSPPNRTLSPNMMLESGQNRVFNFKELPLNENEPKTQHQIFAVIVPKAKPQDFTNLIEMRSKNDTSSDSYKNSIHTSMASSILKCGQSESSDSTKKCLSDMKISNSGSSSRASINLELQYIEGNMNYINDSPFDINTDCSSSEDENLMLLSENGGSKITMQTIPKDKDVLKESQLKTELGLNKINKYANLDNEYSDPNDKENLVNYSGDNPVYLATLNGDILPQIDLEKSPKSPKPCLKNLAIKRQHSLEHVGEIFTSSGDLNLQNPAGRVKTPGDIPVAIRRARSRALQKSRTNDSNRLSLYDDRMMFGNSL